MSELHSPFDPETVAFELLDELGVRFPLRRKPQIVWKPYRVTAGMAYYREWKIGLSRTVLDTPEKLRNTLLHEYAHLLAFERAGTHGKGHGAPWRQAMHELGLPPTVRHRYDVQRNQTRQEVWYGCKKCGHKFARSRRLPHKRKYVHRDCGGFLSLLEVRKLSE